MRGLDYNLFGETLPFALIVHSFRGQDSAFALCACAASVPETPPLPCVSSAIL